MFLICYGFKCPSLFLLTLTFFCIPAIPKCNVTIFKQYMKTVTLVAKLLAKVFSQ